MPMIVNIDDNILVTVTFNMVLHP